MEVNLNEFLITYSEKAIALEILCDVIVDNILIKVLALDKELCIISKFN
jgi:hypothetical protein